MATYQTSQLPALPHDVGIAFEQGHIDPISAPLNAYWDRSDEDEHEDLDWIGVRPGAGVWTKVHPETALGWYPELWDVMAEWWCGLHELTREDFESKSAFEYAAKACLVNSRHRPPPKQKADDDG